MIRSLLLLQQQQQHQQPPGAGAIVASSWPSSLEDQPASQPVSNGGREAKTAAVAARPGRLPATAAASWRPVFEIIRSRQASKEEAAAAATAIPPQLYDHDHHCARSLARCVPSSIAGCLLAGLLGLLCAANGRNSCFHMKELKELRGKEKRMKTEGQSAEKKGRGRNNEPKGNSVSVKIGSLSRDQIE